MATGRGQCAVVLSKFEITFKWIREVDDETGLASELLIPIN